ncbi:hypothetical protein ACFX13_029554 [Malus domestica]
MAPRKLLDFWVVVFFLIALFLRRGSAENVNNYFPSFNFRNLTGLTREFTVPSSSSGAVIYNNPILFFDPEFKLLEFEARKAGFERRDRSLRASEGGYVRKWTIWDWESHIITSSNIPVSGSGDKHHRRLGLGLGIAGLAFFCVALLVFGYVSVTKWMEVRRQKSFKAEVVASLREFSYKELKYANEGFIPVGF